MVPASNLLAFGIAALLLVLLPGPSVLFVIGRSLALGRTGGLLSVLGNELGVVPQIAAVALGVGVVVAQSVVLFTIVKIAGAAYLAYLGIKAVLHSRGTGQKAAAATVRRSPMRLLAEGFIVGVTNPKSIIFFVAVLPQFVDYGARAIPLQLATLGLIYLVIALVCDSVWALVAGTARDWFARSPKRMARLEATGGAMMIGLGGVLVFTGSKS
ncbi:LysE family translocator [Compostimonas suwonensis]|uniref:Threonine/homoserine/homoserine lactone efflux protein n=1 Tax=Compostimonas suwonensis TaxID=1048394 RepID=A0A2M9C3V5_9MICO|nr:LysE family translocator [Compostimonas suwonensis]PJJ65211.1 threonine/homoserine/homoserine lactone efflux protein [Compostimonas suwonensis]